MKISAQKISACNAHGGFTLTEVMIAVAMVVIMLQAIVYGYIMSAQRAEWSAYSLAAQSLASQAVEQARSAKWDPQAFPPVDELGETNYMSRETLDIPISGAAFATNHIFATNFVRVSNVSTNPLHRQIRADCVWKLGRRGLFTNTIITLRAPDQ